jgi:hypothetical protein
MFAGWITFYYPSSSGVHRGPQFRIKISVSFLVRIYHLILPSPNTVDGRNPAPVDTWFIPFFIGFQPSKLVQDFFHPQYVTYLAMVIGPTSFQGPMTKPR